MSKETVLEITSRTQIAALNPMEKDEESYDVVKCMTDVLSSTLPKRAFCEGFTKMPYLAKNKFIFSAYLDRKKFHSYRECGLGRTLVFREDLGVWESTGLRIQRWLNTMQFVVVDNYTEEGTGREIITAKRMPKFTIEEGKVPVDYPYHSVVRLPLSFYDDTFFALIKKIKKTRGFWGKEEDVKKYVANYTDWKFHPTQFCLTCGHQHGGAHRLYASRLMGREFHDVVIYRCWWKDGIPFDPTLLYDWGWNKYDKK